MASERDWALKDRRMLTGRNVGSYVRLVAVSFGRDVSDVGVLIRIDNGIAKVQWIDRNGKATELQRIPISHLQEA